jgi:hypothetical protein
MSLESALAAESSSLRPSQRGRDLSLSPTATNTHIRSTSRGRDRGRSSSRRRNVSRARSQGEDVNYRWSLLTHDPYERFEGKLDRPDGAPLAEDDYSDEEQVSDDEGDLEFDINEITLPNYRCSINDYYKRRSSFGLGSSGSSERQKIIDQNHERLKQKMQEMLLMTEAIALQKAKEEAVSSGNPVSPNISEAIDSKLKELGVSMDKMKTEDYSKFENRKEKTIEEYKKYLAEMSSKPQGVFPSTISEKNIQMSEIETNEDSMRASRAVTLGDFFQTNKKTKDVRTYIIYMDVGAESQMVLQYAIGAIVNSGDVVYVISSSEVKSHPLEHYKNECERLSESVKNCLNLIYDPEFKLHVVMQSTYREYTKHFVNQLVKYLKPTLFIVAHELLVSTDKMSNYMTPCPMNIIKRRARRKSFGY